MTLTEIKAAVLAGRTVHWASKAYKVMHYDGEFMIECSINGHCICLTWRDAVTLNGKPEQFFIAEDQ